MSIDHDEFRHQARTKWEGQAAGWEARREAFRRDTTPVTDALLELLALQPGETLLEVAAGTGDVGLTAARLVQPGGRAILTDGATAMVEAMRRAATAAGVEVEVRQMEAEWLDQETASIDALVARWGYMLLADPEAALREARRVLKPGHGRIALACWTHAQDNPWLAIGTTVLVDRGHTERPPAGTPGPFSLPTEQDLLDVLLPAGFADVEVRTVDFTFHGESADAWWDHLVAMSGSMPAVLKGLTPAEHTAVRDDFDAALAPFTAPGGAVTLPARTLVARADA